MKDITQYERNPFAVFQSPFVIQSDDELRVWEKVRGMISTHRQRSAGKNTACQQLSLIPGFLSSSVCVRLTKYHRIKNSNRPPIEQLCSFAQ